MRSCTISVRINCLAAEPVATYVNLTLRGKRMDGGHLGREILLLLLVWQLVESVELWRVVRNYEQQAKKRRSKRKKRQKRSPAEFQGLIKKPLCEQRVADEDQDSPVVRTAPPLLVQKRGRPRQVDTAHQYCPNEQCDYYGWTCTVRILRHQACSRTSCPEHRFCRSRNGYQTARGKYRGCLRIYSRQAETAC